MLEHGIYRDCFSSADMRAIWCEHATISAWLEVEKALARQQAAADLISRDAADAIAALSSDDLDTGQLHREMMLVGRPIVGLVGQMRSKLGGYASAFHYKATTQDIMDTALTLQMKLALQHLRAGLRLIVMNLDRHIANNGETEMMGRTNGQHAVPMRLATKLGVWRSELLRRAEAIEEASNRGLNAQIGGPVGDLRSYGKGSGEEIKSGVARALGLNTVEPHWQNARDGVADIVCALGSLCASLCKIAHNVNLLSSTDIAEFSETHTPGKGASSAMAHKRNQRASEFAEAVARLGRQRAEQVGELTLHQHERSGGAWIGEWLVVPETFLLTSGAVAWMNRLLENLVIDTAAMREKLTEYECKDRGLT